MSNGIRRGLLDLIDGGGIGAEGDKFEGGGLLSMIANAIATPYGSEDRMRDAMQGQRPMSRPTGGVGNGSIASASAGSAPAPGYTLPGTLAEMSDLAGDRAMPLTKASDIPGGFTPANNAPVQVEGLGMPLTGASDIPGGFTPANDAPVQIASVGDNTGFGSSLQGLGQSPNYSAPKDPYIVQNPPNNLPNAPQQDALPDMTPSLGEFVEFLNRHYDPDFVRRVTLDSDQFNNAYRLFVNNGGKLTP